jgi:hypothetical protein
MTTITDVGLEAIGDVLIGNQPVGIDALAIGTGTGTESVDASALGSEVFRTNVSTGKAELIESGPTGETELAIRFTGGLDVPALAPITEAAAFINGSGGGGAMVLIDNFSKTEVETGDTEEITIPLDPLRSV